MLIQFLATKDWEFFSIWKTLFPITMTMLPLLAVYSERTDLKMTRADFLPWALAVLVGLPGIVLAVFDFLDHSTYDADTRVNAVMVMGILVHIPYWFLYQRYVRRARDAGLSRKTCYWAGVPFAQIILALVLVFRRSRLS